MTPRYHHSPSGVDFNKPKRYFFTYLHEVVHSPSFIVMDLYGHTFRKDFSTQESESFC